MVLIPSQMKQLSITKVINCVMLLIQSVTVRLIWYTTVTAAAELIYIIMIASRRIEYASAVNVVCGHAYEYGLPADVLDILIETITRPNGLNQSANTGIIKSLYPAGKVSSDVVFRVVGCLGPGQSKPSPSTQASLLKWLIMVYEVLEDPKALISLYGVLFNMLDMISLRAPLCHLLSLITRRKNVKPFRIQMLLELSRSVGYEPAISGLIRVFQNYYPDIMQYHHQGRKASYFAHPNPEWRERLHAIQEAQARIAAVFHPQESSFRVLRNGAKRSRVSALPEVHTSHASESSITLEEIENVEDFINKLEKLEYPNQMISALGDPLLQKLVVLKPSKVISRRIESWLESFFLEDMQMLESFQDNALLLPLLSQLLSFVRYTKSLNAPLRWYLPQYIESRGWNDLPPDRIVTELLSYSELDDFRDLQGSYFSTLESVILSVPISGLDENTPESRARLLEHNRKAQISILDFYTSLLRRWTIRFLSAAPAIPVSPITDLFNHVSTLCLTILCNSPTQATTSSILSFYETFTELLSHVPTHPHIHIAVPPSQIVYLLFFSPSLTTLSRLCSILAAYKRAFEASMAPHTPARRSSTVHTVGAIPPASYPRDYINHFNGYLIDICNCLWRNRAFNPDDPNALACLLPPTLLAPLRTYTEKTLRDTATLSSIFSLSLDTRICRASSTCFRDLEDGAESESTETGQPRQLKARHVGPVTARSLSKLARDGGLEVGWQEYRLDVLKWLGMRGVKGIGELMFCTMKHLMGK
ncbi:MAG: hypothetical protein M1819_004281 [Sarea resinae]|nr:MAG: hypothetical protein M1819_004281 [Sarea resinae]